MKRSVVVLLLLAACSREGKAPAAQPIIVGSKNFSESVLLGEIAAQQLERSGCSVERKLNLGGTFVCDAAMQNGSLDLYPEYSGTALTAIFKKPTALEKSVVDAQVSAAYKARSLQWGPTLGFNNTFAIIVRKSDAQAKGLRTISDLARVQSGFRPGFGYEFVERADGWSGLQQKYGLTFSEAPRTMDLGLTYKALASSQVDVIAGNSTDGLIDSLGLVVLEDDRHYFPPYDAAFVTRDLAAKCAAAPAALANLRGAIDEQHMRALNLKVDGEKKDVAEVAAEFLKSVK